MNIKSAGKELMNILDYNGLKLNNTEGVKLAFPKQKWQISGIYRLWCSEDLVPLQDYKNLQVRFSKMWWF